MSERYINLTKGQVAKVDLEDLDLLLPHKWCLVAGGKYAGRKVDGGTQYMHKLIMNHPKLPVDHINGDTLDNRRSNLRICTHSQNSKNRRPNSSVGSSIYKGVDYQPRYGRWRARIRIDYKPIYLGDFDSEIEAAKAYNDAAIRFHGEYASINRIEGNF